MKHCQCITNIWSRSQPQSVTALWPIPNHTAWRQRHTGVSSLPKATAQWGQLAPLCSGLGQAAAGLELATYKLNRKSAALSIAQPRHWSISSRCENHVWTNSRNDCCDSNINYHSPLFTGYWCNYLCQWSLADPQIHEMYHHTQLHFQVGSHVLSNQYNLNFYNGLNS